MVAALPNGNGFKNPLAFPAAVRALYAAAQNKTMVSQWTFTNGDAIGSVYHLGWVPSNAIIDPRSVAIVQPITGLTSVSVGISGPGGQAVNPGVANCLVNAQDWHAGGSFSLAQNVAPANVQQQAWQLAGLASDPGGVLEIYATIGAAPTATGVATTFLERLTDV